MSLDISLSYRQPRLSDIEIDGTPVTYTRLYDALGITENRELEFESVQVFDTNITHNLNKMAEAANLYTYLWRPEELNITTAQQLIAPLLEGYRLLVSNPMQFKILNPANGWGTYEGLVKVVYDYYLACVDYPSATVWVSR